MKTETPALQFQSRNLFREWLCENFDTSGGVWLVFDKHAINQFNLQEAKNEN
jgi:CRISPR/Cas system-associated protein Cas10 (large subunit of type III CRISPR-Cas system)